MHTENEQDYKMTISEVLYNVSVGIFPEWWCFEIGLCNQDWHYCTDYDDMFEKQNHTEFVCMSEVFALYWAEWDHFSGDDSYPVKSPYGDNHHGMYDEADSHYELEYGESRKQLAAFLSEKLK
ncbi:hypothetical protein AP1_0185 [Aeromonas phage AP1]|uniref:Uncharacterized protein n=2 Tax=Caudoviricetes TaxID=2731619 RepID=A0A291LEQ5_9CAUD|nr:hypothetical protein [Aeromonas phage AS-szw]QAX99018.1 hypothetical protein assk_227 [Aeromonas phage Assk]QMV28892.1 hypothetical protein AP1_0185 [Aeromonas phage AP1]